MTTAADVEKLLTATGHIILMSSIDELNTNHRWWVIYNNGWVEQGIRYGKPSSLEYTSYVTYPWKMYSIDYHLTISSEGVNTGGYGTCAKDHIMRGTRTITGCAISSCIGGNGHYDYYWVTVHGFLHPSVFDYENGKMR